jgi:thioredoxin 1
MSHVDLDSQTFQKEVLDEKEKIVIVDFWADWCMPCHMLSPVIEEVSEEYKDKVKVCKLDVDASSDRASEYQVMSIPNVVFFKEGKEVARLIGVRPKADFVKQIEELL